MTSRRRVGLVAIIASGILGQAVMADYVWTATPNDDSQVTQPISTNAVLTWGQNDSPCTGGGIQVSVQPAVGEGYSGTITVDPDTVTIRQADDTAAFNSSQGQAGTVTFNPALKSGDKVTITYMAEVSGQVSDVLHLTIQ